MRYIALLTAMVCLPLYAQTATTNCHTVEGFLSCTMQQHDAPSAPALSGIDPSVVQQIAERLLDTELRALNDAGWKARAQLAEKHVSPEEWKRQFYAMTLQNAVDWLGRQPSQAAWARWTAAEEAKASSWLGAAKQVENKKSAAH